MVIQLWGLRLTVFVLFNFNIICLLVCELTLPFNLLQFNSQRNLDQSLENFFRYAPDYIVKLGFRSHFIEL